MIKKMGFDVDRACKRVEKGCTDGWGKKGQNEDDSEEKNENGDGVNEDEEYVKNLGPLRFATMELVEMVRMYVLCVCMYEACSVGSFSCAIIMEMV
jgi:hypothetical protein